MGKILFLAVGPLVRRQLMPAIDAALDEIQHAAELNRARKDAAQQVVHGATIRKLSLKHMDSIDVWYFAAQLREPKNTHTLLHMIESQDALIDNEKIWFRKSSILER